MTRIRSKKEKDLYDVFGVLEVFQSRFERACHKGCHDCCTQSVTMTAFEGEILLEYYQLIKGNLHDLAHALFECVGEPDKVLMTPNNYVQRFLDREDFVEEQPPWNMQPCIFLEESLCGVYPVRPLGCRLFTSRAKCGDSGTAQIPAIVLTVNTIFQQLVEHLDAGRPWGAMNSILRYVLGGGDAPADLAVSRPVPGFYVPDEERKDVAGVLHDLKTLGINSMNFFGGE